MHKRVALYFRKSATVGALRTVAYSNAPNLNRLFVDEDRKFLGSYAETVIPLCRKAFQLALWQVHRYEGMDTREDSTLLNVFNLSRLVIHAELRGGLVHSYTVFLRYHGVGLSYSIVAQDTVKL